MSKKRWEEETLKPTLDNYPERDEVKLDERERLNTPGDISNNEPEFPAESSAVITASRMIGFKSLSCVLFSLEKR